MTIQIDPPKPTQYSPLSPARVYCFTGLPGVGKSTLSEAFIERLIETDTHNREDIVWIRNDEVRKELFNNPTYTAEESRKTYYQTIARVQREILNNNIVVCDSTFSNNKYRIALANTTYMYATPLTFIHVTCPEDIAKERIKTRENNVSDADTDVYDIVNESFDEFTDAAEYNVVTAHTDAPVDETVSNIMETINTQNPF